MNHSTIYQTDGKSESERLQSALVDSTFNVHGLSSWQLLSCCSRYGQYIQYYNLNNQIDGTWADAFFSDELAMIADIHCFRFDKYVGKLLFELKDTKDNYNNLINEIFRIILKVDHWIKILKDFDNNHSAFFVRAINQYIDGAFSEHYIKLISVAKSISGKDRINIPALKGSWRKYTSENVPVYSSNDFKPVLKSILLALHNLFLTIKKNLRIFLDESLKRSDHSPETGLLFTFLQLFETVQTEINSLPEKYVLFYYQKILQFPLKEPSQDTTFVTLKCDESIKNELLIPADTEFIAEVNDVSIAYRAERDVIIKNVEVSSLFSLYLEKDVFKEPEKSLGYYSSVRVADYSDDNSNGKCFPLFSIPKDVSINEKFNPMHIGFAFSSRILFLAEGERTVTLSFLLDEFLSEIWGVELKKKILSSFNENEESSDKIWKQLCIKILKSLFVIELTTINGWYKVEHYHPNSSVIDSKCNSNSLILQFIIPVSAPAITSYEQSLHGESFNTNLPVCKVTFNQDAEVFPYSLLKGLKIDSLQIDVDVNGCHDLFLYNQFGTIDQNTPFAPFGPMPEKGNSIIISSNEIARKSVDSVDIDIEWANVPWNENGFSEYYKGYSYPFNNNSFIVEISELKDGTWSVCDDDKMNNILLFETDGPDKKSGYGKVSTRKLIHNIKVQSFKEKQAYLSYDDFQFTSKSKNGFLRMTLVEPHCGFGQSLYANDIASSFLKKINLKNDTAIPSPPFFPVISRISLNYHAKTTMNLSRIKDLSSPLNGLDSFYHLLPFGHHHLYPFSESVTVPIIPMIDQVMPFESLSGNLFIGLKGQQIPGVLSLFIKLSEDIYNGSEEPVHWFYLSNNEWIRIDQNQILSDSTYNLTVSGIITLNIPEKINDDNTVLPSGLHWLRASVVRNGEKFGIANKIETNALKLVRKNGDNGQTRSIQSIPVNVIKKTSKSIPGVDGITQQCASSGKSFQETTKKYMVRVSECLRSKQRITTVTDYEQGVLENFPEIFKVKCFPNFVAHDHTRFYPGNVLICVVPKLKENESIAFQYPKAPIHLLKEIKFFLQSRSTAAININVINPVFEEIQVRCSLKLKSSSLKGDLINEINNSISDYISPWSAIGNKVCFGWKIKLSDIQHYITELPSVNSVTNFSLLHKSSINQIKFDLDDSAEKSNNNQTWISSKIPWSICIPFKKHAIEVIDHQFSTDAAITGISKMEISSIFILKGNSNHGDAKQENT